MNDFIEIILVDDHQIVRDGLKALLFGHPRIKVTGEAVNYESLKELLIKRTPDIIIMDINLPDISGIEIAKKIQITHPSIKIIILSMYIQDDFIFNAVKSGVKGYLPKDVTKTEFITAIEKVHEGEEYFNASVSKVMLKNYVNDLQKGNQETDKKNFSLTKRETEILKLYAEGYSNQEIADKLFISIRTVESHKNHIMSKLDIKTPVDLIKYAIRNGIVNL